MEKKFFKEKREIVDDIKNRLRRHGGIVITNRTVGKTQALIELMIEENAYIVVMNDRQKIYIRSLFVKLFPGIKMPDRVKIYHNMANIDWGHSYVDEILFFNNRIPCFKGAVSSMPYPMEIIQYTHKNTDFKKAEEALGSRQFAIEHSLDFSVEPEEGLCEI